MHNLITLLKGIGTKGYKSYQRIGGEYSFGGFTFYIDHVQGDPFADPSRCRVVLPLASLALPQRLYHNSVRRIALEDFIGRRFRAAIAGLVAGRCGSGRSGEFAIASYGQQVLRRNTVLIGAAHIEVRFQIGLPAQGRRIDAEAAELMLCDEMPMVVNRALLQVAGVLEAAERQVNCIENQHCLRSQLDARGLIGFIADGSSLPRQSGIDDRPLPQARVIIAPDSLACKLVSNLGSPVRGLGIPTGINLVVGGGFHGKSTLLRAIEQGVYDHIPGDGRELVVSRTDCVKLRAEDGRAVNGVDIRPFIQNLPGAIDCAFFTTANASGSSSQAASFVETLSAGSTTLLIDEDTSATNFLIRDRQMQRLVPDSKEPITPLKQRLRQLRENHHVSLMIVMGGSSEYLSVADSVVMMDNYQPVDVTQAAKEISAVGTEPVVNTPRFKCIQGRPRIPCKVCLSSLGPTGKTTIKAFGTRVLIYGKEEVSGQALEQLADGAQLLAIGYLVDYYQRKVMDGKVELIEGLKFALSELEQQGFDLITPYPMGKLALPRLQELFAVVNRMRLLKLQ